MDRIHVYAEVAGSLVKIGAGTVAAVRGAMQSNGIDADKAALDVVDRQYQARLDRRYDYDLLVFGTTGD